MSGEPSSASRRAAAQQLSSLRAAGVTRIASRTPKKTAASPGKKGASATQPAPAAPTCPQQGSTQSGLTQPGSLFDAQRSTMPGVERDEKLRILAGRVAKCTRCAELASTRTQTVFGVGNPQAQIMFVGEAPGADEDRQGEPFVGAAGQLLNRILEACQLKRADIYICNILRCRPPGNRTPAPEEAANCREYLDGQIEIVDPDYIVCLGSVAAKNLLGSVESIGKLRGRFFNYGRAKVLCTYHPAYLLRNPAAKKDVWGDMKFLMRELGVDL
ncbi:MAG TPA: uracil-DNA glycosylase [Planctomycetaceae bacterium]|jgi:DNA polymerase|nr:uracil-DNA glycosylase [Planctomycetaceae bacterium]